MFFFTIKLAFLSYEATSNKNMRPSSHMERQGRTVIFSTDIQDGLMRYQFLSNSDIKDHQVT